MLKVDTSYVNLFPPHYAGKWRLTIGGDYLDKQGVKTTACYIFNFDLFDKPMLMKKKF